MKRVDMGDGASFVGLQGLGDLEWQLRYGDAEEVRLTAAAVVACYQELVLMPQRSRNQYIAKIMRHDANPITN